MCENFPKQIVEFDDIETFKNWTNEEHAIHHKRAVDQFEKNDKEHDNLWDVVTALQDKIDRLGI
jgi:hypothetical protein